jgi:hypothetical protein
MTTYETEPVGKTLQQLLQDAKTEAATLRIENTRLHTGE